MSDTLKKFLIDTVIGFAIALLACWAMGVFTAEQTVDTVRILSDGFFLAGAMLLAMGGLTWTYNGGVMDGLGFTFKTAISRVKREYETEKLTFAEYRAQREAKASSPVSMLLAGLVHLAIALVFLFLYNGM